jgi:UDP-glucose 4-epimerase
MSHLDDVVDANIFAMNYEGEFKGQPFDVGTGDNISLNEIKDIVLKHFPEVVFDYVEARKGDVLTTKADMSPLKELGWEPSRNIRDGIEECFTILKDKLP